MATSQLDFETIRKNLDGVKEIRVMLGTPMLDSKCHAGYKNSVIDLVNLLNRWGVQLNIFDIYGQSVISHARNIIAGGFMNSSFDRPDDRLLLIDSDITFQAEDILHMIVLDKDIIAAPCTSKTINWERIRQASLLGYQANELPALGGDIITDFITDGGYVDDPVEVKTVGTGVMMIKRSVLQRMKEALPEIKYTKIPPVTMRGGNSPGEDAYAYFQAIIDPNPPYYNLTEDWVFCNRARKLGIKTYICLWMKTIHMGSFAYLMDIPATAEFLQKKEEFEKRIVSDRIEKEAKERKEIEKLVEAE